MAITIVLTFKQWSQADQMAFATSVVQRMSANPLFTSIKPQVDALKNAIDAYTVAAAEALYGGKDRVFEKNQRFDALQNLLIMMTRHVEIVANGDENVVLAAGFELRKPRTKPDYDVVVPSNFAVANGFNSGSVKLSWDTQPAAINYAVEYLVKGETAWRNGTYTSNREIVMTGFEPGSYVAFRVCALGRKTAKSDWTQPQGTWVV